ncbi:MAG TPA: hypothetical protein VHC41_04510 [Mycobacteriales bacterium]|nr:hypothetical protein [Mycobacteriales bacterium]
MSAKRRVVVWGTGTIGAPGLKAIIEHPELELVGVHAWSADKLGVDAGKIAGTSDTGVITTNDLDALLDLGADCLAHFGNGALREAECNAEMIPFLKRGTNVVTCSQMDIFMPRYGRQEFVRPVAQACEEGKSSIFSTGVEPGYCTTGFPLSLLSVAGRVDEVHLAEIADVSAYTGVESLKLYGFGEPLDFEPPIYAEGIGEAWHMSTVRSMAEYLGVELDDVTSIWENAGLDRDQETSFGLIKAGRTMATRWTITGLSNGKPVVIYKKIERLHLDAGNDWEYAKLGAGEAAWRIQIVGQPSMVSEINADLASGCAMVALHPVNAIPVVCDAAPGILDPAKLPHFYSRTLGAGIERAAAVS